MSYVMPIHRTITVPYAVGIDADIDKSGLAIYSRIERRLVYVESIEIHKFLDRVNEIKVGEAVFFVDAGWLNEGFHHYAGMPDGFEKWSEKSKMAYMVKCGIQVGRNFGVGQVIVSYLRALHGEKAVMEVRPASEKWDKYDLKRYTGWTKRTNSEARDAAKLCFQR